jgi:phasin family protein
MVERSTVEHLAKLDGLIAPAGEIFMATAKTKITTTLPTFDTPQFAEVAAQGKKNLDAYVASVSAAQAGAQTLTQRAVAFSKVATENHVAATKDLLASKSAQEFVEKQTAYLKSAFEAYVAETKAVQGLFAGIAQDVIKPLNSRALEVRELMPSVR